MKSRSWRRRVAVVALLPTLALAACQAASPPVESPDARFVRLARLAIPGGIPDLPDASLLAAGRAACDAASETDAWAPESAAVRVVYDALGRYDAGAFDAVAVTVAMGPLVLCPDPIASGSASSGSPSSVGPLPSLDVGSMREGLRAGLAATMESMSSGGTVVLSGVEVDDLGAGSLAAEATVASQFVDLADEIAYSLVQQAAQFVSLGPSTLALLFGTPDWTTDLSLITPGAGTARFVTDAGTLVRVADGLSLDDWLAAIAE